MTDSNLPSKFQRTAEYGDVPYPVLRLCTLHRVEKVETIDGDSTTNAVQLLGFRRHQMSSPHFIEEFHLAIMDDLELLNDEFYHDACVLDAHFNERADPEFHIASPYLNDEVDRIDVFYRLTMDDGAGYDLFVMKGRLLSHVSEQVETHIRHALKAVDMPKPKLCALVKSTPSPDAAP